jgi:5-methylcytosine-specific restriction endonuclease McrA
MVKYNREEFIEICESSASMSDAAIKLNIHFNTLKRIAIKLGCYSTNQGGIGINKNWKNKTKTNDILDGKYPGFQTYKLKLRLFNEGIKENKCEECGISEWMGKKINCDLDHVDGNRTNHKFENLRILCPNCHSQTPTYKSKNIKPR